MVLNLVLIPLVLELATELRLERPLSLAELVSMGELCDGESRHRSNLTAESGLSGSGLLRFTLALFFAALLRNERREFNICKQQKNTCAWKGMLLMESLFKPLKQADGALMLGHTVLKIQVHLFKESHMLRLQIGTCACPRFPVIKTECLLTSCMSRGSSS